MSDKNVTKGADASKDAGPKAVPSKDASQKKSEKKTKPKKNWFPRWLKLSLIAGLMTIVVAGVSLVLFIKTEERNLLDDDLISVTSSNVGGAVRQESPSLNALDSDSMLFKSFSMELQDEEGYELTTEIAEDYVENTNLVSTTGDVVINLELKKRGLRYDPTYTTKFSAVYVLENTSDEEVAVEFEFPFPENLRDKEINNAVLLVDGVEQEKPVRQEEVESGVAVLYDYEEQDYYDYYDPYYYDEPPEETTVKTGMYWEGTIDAEGDREIEVRYNTVGLGEFSYVGLENPEGAQDFVFEVKVLGSRKYDNTGSLTIDEKEYITENGENGVILTWNKQDLFSNPNIEISVAPRVNPSRHLSEIYSIMIPLYIGFAAAVILMVSLLKKEFGGVDMMLTALLFAIYFPFLHYLVSFNIDPSADVLFNYSGVVDFSMPLYLAFAIALGIVGGLMLYLFARVSGSKFAFGIGLPLILVFMGFFPLAMTLPEYKYLLVLFGVVALLAIVVQMRVSRKMTLTEKDK
jgi:hypothetical protein